MLSLQKDFLHFAFFIMNSLPFIQDYIYKILIYFAFSTCNPQLQLPGFQNNFCGSLRNFSLFYLFI